MRCHITIVGWEFRLIGMQILKPSPRDSNKHEFPNQSFQNPWGTQNNSIITFLKENYYIFLYIILC